METTETAETTALKCAERSAETLQRANDLTNQECEAWDSLVRQADAWIRLGLFIRDTSL